MKKLIISTFLISSLYSGEIAVKFLKTENPAGGAHTWIDKYSVIVNGKECIYEYSVGVYTGVINNLCTGKSNSFTFRKSEPRAKPLKYTLKKYIDPYFYSQAYSLLIKGKKSLKDTTVISKKNSKGIKIFCLKDMSSCKTEKEILNYIRK